MFSYPSKGLCTKTSSPLSEIETVFAVDATGIGISRKMTWIDIQKTQDIKREIPVEYIKTTSLPNT